MEGYLGEIRMFTGPFAPRGWMYCHGQLLAISQNTALFHLLGKTYGGDGRTTFGLPDLRGRFVAGIGNADGLKKVNLGEMYGEPTITLKVENLPPHKHELKIKVSTEDAEESNPTHVLASAMAYNEDPTEGVFLSGVRDETRFYNNSRPINNYGPYMEIRYIICVYGTYPRLKQS